VLAAALVGIVGAIAAIQFTVTRGDDADSDASGSPPAPLSEREQADTAQLLSHVPAGFRNECERQDDPYFEQAVASVICWNTHLKGVSWAEYALFLTKEHLDEWFRGKAVPAGTEPCAVKGAERLATYSSKSGEPAGKVYCRRLKPELHPWIVWTNDRLKIGAEATLTQRFYEPALYRSWKCCLGPE